MPSKDQWKWGEYSVSIVPRSKRALSMENTVEEGADLIECNNEFVYDAETVPGTATPGVHYEVNAEDLAFFYMTRVHDYDVDRIDSIKSQNIDRAKDKYEKYQGFRQWIGEEIIDRMDDSVLNNLCEFDDITNADALAKWALDRDGLNGTPDFILGDFLSKREGTNPNFRFVEVKGPNDRLHSNQLRWFRIFDEVFPSYSLRFEQLEEYDLDDLDY